MPKHIAHPKVTISFTLDPALVAMLDQHAVAGEGRSALIREILRQHFGLTKKQIAAPVTAGILAP